jgi:multiple sugar transport system substrate-binding protein
MKYAGTIVRPNHGYLLYDEGALWTQVITPVVAEVKLISTAWSAYQSALVDNAKVNGYSVTT